MGDLAGIESWGEDEAGVWHGDCVQQYVWIHFLRIPFLNALCDVSDVRSGNLVADVRNLVVAPPSPNVTLDTELDYGVLAPKQKVGNVLSSIDGPFCYAYI